MCRDSACARCIRSPLTGQGLQAHFPSWFHHLLTFGVSRSRWTIHLAGRLGGPNAKSIKTTVGD